MRRVEGEFDGVDYHQFWLAAAEPEPLPDELITPMEGKATRLLSTTQRAVAVTTGVAMGMARLAIEFLDREPDQLDDSQQWEAVAEVSFAPQTPAVTIRLLMDDPPPLFSNLELPPSDAWYRVRGHAVGRSIDFDGVADEPVEDYLLQIWPTDAFEEQRDIREDNPWEDRPPQP